MDIISRRAPTLPDNKLKFTNYLLNEDWSDLFQCSDAESAFGLFTTKLTSFYKQSFPITTKTINRKRNNPWLTPALKKSINHKNKLYVLFHKRPTVANEVEYKAYKCALKKLINLAQKTYFHNQLDLNKNDLRKTWSILRELIDSKKGNEHIFKISVVIHQ